MAEKQVLDALFSEKPLSTKGFVGVLCVQLSQAVSWVAEVDVTVASNFLSPVCARLCTDARHCLFLNDNNSHP